MRVQEPANAGDSQRPRVRVRIGIDVGGTFTDVVALDAESGALIGSLKVPTTHRAPEGVARGIVDALEAAMQAWGLAADDVVFLAHSTTQATNALLEGDLARVGILVFGAGLEGALARAAARVPPWHLSAGVEIRPLYGWFSTRRPERLGEALDALRAAGAEAVVAADAFSVDRPAREAHVAAVARERVGFATATHEISTLYGLRVRTRTAVVNAAVLPTMVRTARMTAGAARSAGIPAPLMIMRSDGGVMDAAEMERRPVATMLSGPAAGVAGALFHERLSEGIFVEVGGTSSDCSAIVDGRPQTRAATLGGARTTVEALDVRTLGLAGGSLARLRDGAVVELGPRSAHIAGLRYASFAAPETFEQAVLTTSGDPYLVLDGSDGGRYALTPTCAANALGAVPEGAFARAPDPAAARAAFACAARALRTDADALARRILDLAAERLGEVLAALRRAYELTPPVTIVGGGGGAGALIPYAAERLGYRWRLARDAEVISPIGVALALVRDVVERTVVDPSPDDVVRVRAEAEAAAVRSGADPAGVQVAVEVDARRNRVRAVATGATALGGAARRRPAGEPDKRAEAARALACDPEALREAARTPRFVAYLSPERRLAAVDETGVVRLRRRDAWARALAAGEVVPELERALERWTTFGDVGRALPRCALLLGTRVVEVGDVAAAAQAVALAREELRSMPHDEPVGIVLSRQRA
ncbi:MAG TPA: hydantoinase/oxoprolinase family protein [Candidatus Dormibacteraeota bacterium]|nr:hydantoinase/oxoprolinase family protein [Candidatus Dormibacteraeota bacterium]